MDYTVRQIPPEQTHEWLLKKHYAKRIPQINYAFGLYDANLLLQGIVVFGNPQRMLNNGAFNNGFQCTCQELSRLVINEGLPKNTLSFFVSGALKLLPQPMLVVSYADENKGHHGYIYQATNWYYTGITGKDYYYTDTRTNKTYHGRTIVDMYGSRSPTKLPEYISVEQEETGKHRYFFMLADKHTKINMLKHFTFKMKPYPKGDNQRYDASYQPPTQGVLV